MNKPFFSVVIPTRNRIEPLQLTLQSVLQQEFTDWECVVVDNNDDDKLKDLFADISDPRVSRMKTGGLHMADNWDAALQAGTGEYVVLINDKQCLYGHALLLAHQKLKDGLHELLLWGGDVLNDLDPANIIVGKHSGDRKFRIVHSDDVLAEFTLATKSARRKFTSFPKAFVMGCHSVVRRSALEEIRRQTGQKICLPPTPDFTFGCHLLNHLTSYLHFNGSMSFFHAMKLSTGGNHLRLKKDINGFWASLGGDEISYRHVPIKLMILEGHQFNEYIFMRNLLGGRLSKHPLPLEMYYVAMHELLAKSQREGLDRIPELREWRKTLASEPFEMRLRVRSRLLGLDFRRFRRNLRKWSGLPGLEKLFKGNKRKSGAATAKVPSADFFLTEQTQLFRQIDLERN